MRNIRSFLYFIPILVAFKGSRAIELSGPCAKPLAFGKACDTAKPSIRYHFDAATFMCMAFRYNGCGGNKNNFADSMDCSMLCIPQGYTTCPGNTKKMNNRKNDGESCSKDTDCPDKEYCRKRMSGGGFCCRQAASDKFNSDYNPKCAAGRSAIRVDDELLIGKNCSSKFCPAGSNCKKGNFFATCCGKS